MGVTQVTEGPVTVTAGGANSTEAEVRAGAGFQEADPNQTPETPETPPRAPNPQQPDEPEPQTPDEEEPPPDEGDGTVQARHLDGKFGPKVKDPAGDPRRSIQAKINFERRLRAQAERERDEARAETAAARQSAPKPDQPPRQEPARAPSTKDRYLADVKRLQSHPDYPNLNDYLDAGFADPYEAHKTAVDLFVHDARQAEYQTWQSQQTEQQELAQKVAATNEAASAKYPDWDDLLQTDAARIQLPGPVLYEIYADPSTSADVIHHLLSHPDECARLAGVHDPVAAAREVAKLSAVASSAYSGPASQPPSVTRAKPLIKPVKASPAAPAAASIDDMPFGPRYVAAEAKRERELRELRRGG